MLRKLAAVLLVSLLTLALFEGALRVLDLPRYDTCWNPTHPIWVEDPVLTQKLRPGSRTGIAEVNALGLRGPVLPLEKDPGTLRVLFIGDSTVFGLGTPLEETFVHLATSELGALRPEGKAEYLIGAIPGTTSYQSRILLERLLPYRPDLVVFYVGARNDPDRATYYKDSDWPSRYERRRAAWHQLRSLAALELLADTVWKTWLRRLRPRTWQARVPPDEFEENMKAMLEASRAAGVPAVVLMPPYSDSLVKHQKIIPIYQDILRNTAVAYGAPYAELQKVFAPEPVEEVYFRDGFHPKPKGHRLIADEIVRVVREAGLLGTAPAATAATP